jgi:hypothetical protein
MCMQEILLIDLLEILFWTKNNLNGNLNLDFTGTVQLMTLEFVNVQVHSLTDTNIKG